MKAGHVVGLLVASWIVKVVLSQSVTLGARGQPVHAELACEQAQHSTALMRTMQVLDALRHG
jgi:hypothetical protein